MLRRTPGQILAECKVCGKVHGLAAPTKQPLESTVAAIPPIMDPAPARDFQRLRDCPAAMFP